MILRPNLVYLRANEDMVKTFEFRRKNDPTIEKSGASHFLFLLKFIRSIFELPVPR